MLAQEVASKYAQGLFLAAQDKNLVDQGYEQLEDVRDIIKKDRSLINFLQAPQVLDEDKLKLVSDIFTGKLEQLFVEFLLLLVRKHRAGFLIEIIDEYERLVEAERGIGRVTVITAVPITNEEREKLKDQLAKKINLKIVLEEKVKPAILGGMIVITHNEIIDGSIRHALDSFNEQLRKVKVA
ncbi:ATP synthase F1 subunit delta [candidate division GN15 bacterium]|nr:ATP synthase F1 subunit delta [candidate division GN15 bacterium]